MRQTRFPALDGLRGLAALSVLIGHAFWVTPQFAAAVQLKNAGRSDLFEYALTYTPIHLAWLAREAVIVFFVLSGFVLVRPFLTVRRGYGAYYPARLVRLLIPAWGGLLFAWLMAALCYPRAAGVASELLQAQVGVDTSWHALAGFWLIGGTPSILPPLWSLEWELIFSMLLPVYVMVARWSATLVRASIVGSMSVAVAAVGIYLDIPAAKFLPVFMLGALIAANYEQLAARLHGRAAAVVGVVSLIALCAGWYSRGFSGSVALTGVGQAIGVAAAGGVVLSALTWTGFARLLSRDGFVRWLGSRSFSLYLVHFSIIMAAAFLSNGENLVLTLAIGVPASFAVAEVFYRVVELPSKKLSHAIKRAVSESDSTRRAHAAGIPRP